MSICRWLSGAPESGLAMKIYPLLLLVILLAGCAAPVTPPPASPPSLTPLLPTQPAAVLLTPQATVDSYFLSDGGGEPRSAGYWLLWNTCAAENQAAMAKANGGRAAGWILVDDLLADPGMFIAGTPVASCAQAVSLLQGNSLAGEPRTDDPGFSLATQLLTAQLNLEASAESCLGVVDAVLGAQALLGKLGFDGEQVLLGPGNPAESQRAEVALYLTALQQYNVGELCR